MADNRTIKTERLILRPFKESDYDDLFEFLSQLKDDEFEGCPGITYENGKKHLNERVGSDNFFAIELKDSGKVIGNIFFGKREYSTREVGYIVNKDYQRKGYAYEALTAVINYAFRNGVHRVIARCNPRNNASWMLLEKAGLKREAHLKETHFTRLDDNNAPIWQDTYIYTLINDYNMKSTTKILFYGHENSIFKDSHGLTPIDYYSLLSDIWCEYTCAPRMRNKWNKNNKTVGQCSITAFLMQDLFGGDVYGIDIGGGNYHCFNVVDGIKFDLTSEQFEKQLDYDNVVIQDRNIHFKRIEKKERYEYLKERLLSRIANLNND